MRLLGEGVFDGNLWEVTGIWRWDVGKGIGVNWALVFGRE
jgi:hypothetical protein